MKVRVAISDLYKLAERHPNAWHELIPIGQMDSTGHLVIEQHRMLEILERYGSPPLPEHPLVDPIASPPAALPLPRKTESASAIEEICARCEWNVDWICEHGGCQPCRQKVDGGLKAMIAIAGSRCPAAKWA